MGLKEKDGGAPLWRRRVCAVRTAGDSSHGKARDLAIICTFGDARVSGIDGPV